MSFKYWKTNWMECIYALLAYQALAVIPVRILPPGC